MLCAVRAVLRRSGAGMSQDTAVDGRRSWVGCEAHGRRQSHAGKIDEEAYLFVDAVVIACTDYSMLIWGLCVE